MELQSQLRKLFNTVIENSKHLDDGLDMPYSNMCLTASGRHANTMKMPSGKINVQLHDAKYSKKYGFTLFGKKRGKISGWISVNGETKFISDDSPMIPELSLDQLNNQEPQKVADAIQGYLTEVSTLTKDVERTEDAKKYWKSAAEQGFDKYGRPQTPHAERLTMEELPMQRPYDGFPR
ncbi:hypothetical protein FACS189425_07910 [Clostridia bacterium]|nr:hypothetical protein FACS189425_07910 [Clostridia bacterium]